MTSLESKESGGSVYPPSEDTFVLIDAIAELEAAELDEAAEIGCGAGLAALEIARKSRRLVATDLDFSSTIKTYQAFKLGMLNDKVDVVCCSAMDAIRPGKTFDLIVSNPPYLPVTEGELDHDEVSYAGGSDGSRVATEIIEAAVSHSDSRSKVLLIVSTLTTTTPLAELLQKNGFVVEIRQGRSLFFEKILVLQAIRRLEAVSRT